MRHRLLWLLLAMATPAIGCSRAEQPNVVLIVVDTLRSDHLGVYGGREPLSPSIDALAARGWLFERHVAHASQTVPSMLSLMLSQLPADHGFPHRSAGQFQDARPVYPQSFAFLAESLRDAGYATAGFVANPFLAPASGFGQGFDAYEHRSGSDAELTRLAVDWLRNVGSERPYFLYVHYMGVHQPWRPSAEARARFATAPPGLVLSGNRKLPSPDPRDLAWTRALYAACVADVDAQVGLVVRAVDALGRGPETLIALTSDHGEELGEHGGIGHGTTVYGELVRVPLVLVAEGRLEAGRRVATLSRHLDLAPTLLDLAGVRRPASFRGASLLEPAPDAIAEDGPWRGVYAGEHKLAWNVETDRVELFAASDVHDAVPLEDAAPRAALRALLETHRAREAPAPGDASAPAWSDEERERLRSLGYAE